MMTNCNWPNTTCFPIRDIVGRFVNCVVPSFGGDLWTILVRSVTCLKSNETPQGQGRKRLIGQDLERGLRILRENHFRMKSSCELTNFIVHARLADSLHDGTWVNGDTIYEARARILRICKLSPLLHTLPIFSPSNGYFSQNSSAETHTKWRSLLGILPSSTLHFTNRRATLPHCQLCITREMEKGGTLGDHAIFRFTSKWDERGITSHTFVRTPDEILMKYGESTSNSWWDGWGIHQNIIQSTQELVSASDRTAVWSRARCWGHAPQVRQSTEPRCGSRFPRNSRKMCPKNVPKMM